MFHLSPLLMSWDETPQGPSLMSTKSLSPLVTSFSPFTHRNRLPLPFFPFLTPSPTPACFLSQTPARCPHPRQRKAPLLHLQEPKYYHHLIIAILQANFLATAPLQLNRLNVFPGRKMLPSEVISEWRLIWGVATGIER